MSKIYKKVHGICQPLIQAHSDELNTLSSDLMSKASLYTRAVYMQALQDCFVTAYALQTFAPCIDKYIDTDILATRLPEELQQISKAIQARHPIDAYVDDIVSDFIDDFTDDYDTDVDSLSYEFRNEETRYDSREAVEAVFERADSKTKTVFYEAALEFASYYLSKNDYLSAMSYVNLLFTSDAGAFPSLIHETWGTLKDFVSLRTWHEPVADYIHEIKLIYELLRRMHNYENDMFRR